MALKRKRSSATLSSPLSEASDTTYHAASPLSFFYGQTKAVEPLHPKSICSSPTYSDGATDSHLHSRTRKRYRDNRPDDQAIFGAYPSPSRTKTISIDWLYLHSHHPPQTLPGATTTAARACSSNQIFTARAHDPTHRAGAAKHSSFVLANRSTTCCCYTHVD